MSSDDDVSMRRAARASSRRFSDENFSESILKII